MGTLSAAELLRPLPLRKVGRRRSGLVIDTLIAHILVTTVITVIIGPLKVKVIKY